MEDEMELKASEIGRTEIEGIDIGEDNLFDSLSKFDGLEALMALRELIERGACTLLVSDEAFFLRNGQRGLSQRAELVWQMVLDDDSEEGLGAVFLSNRRPRQFRGT